MTKDELLLETLEDAARKLSIRVDYDDLRKGEVNTEGGIFLLKGERRIIIHKGLDPGDRAEVLARLLAGLDTEGVHLPPAVRKMLDDEKARLKGADAPS